MYLPWHELVSDPPAAAHLAFWSDDSPVSDGVLETFLRGGVRRGDLNVVILPQGELGDLGDRMRARGLDLDRMSDEGGLIRTPTEDLEIVALHDTLKLPALRNQLQDIAHSAGRAGLTVLGRVAPPFFERGDHELASAVEETVSDIPEDVRVLCLYRTAALRWDGFPKAVSLTGCHTHAIIAVGGRLVAETVSVRPR